MAQKAPMPTRHTTVFPVDTDNLRPLMTRSKRKQANLRARRKTAQTFGMPVPRILNGKTDNVSISVKSVAHTDMHMQTSPHPQRAAQTGDPRARRPRDGAGTTDCVAAVGSHDADPSRILHSRMPRQETEEAEASDYAPAAPLESSIFSQARDVMA